LCTSAPDAVSERPLRKRKGWMKARILTIVIVPGKITPGRYLLVCSHLTPRTPHGKLSRHPRSCR
jgi:hypothetical protein